MDRKALYRAGLCAVLIAAILLGLMWYPGAAMKTAEPEDPLGDEIRDITVLQVGEDLRSLDPVAVPSGGRSQQTKAADGGTDAPQETRPDTTSADPSANDQGDQGREDGNQGSQGGQESDLDLAAQMTWYRYGNTPSTLVCGVSETVSDTVNTAWLQNNILKYDFALFGADAGKGTITSVSVAEGNSPYRQTGDSGEIEIQLPEDGGRSYTFLVEARVEQQTLRFTFRLACENTIDLNLELSWQRSDGTEKTVSCGPDKTEAFAVNSYELENGLLLYTPRLTGTAAQDAEITGAFFTTASGRSAGELETKGGSLILSPAVGADSETYSLRFTVKTPERDVLFRYELTYREILDVQLRFVWLDGGRTPKELLCRPGETVTQKIKNNQLSAGALSYEKPELTGADSENARITGFHYTSDAGSGPLDPKNGGSLPMTMPAGASANTYRITAEVLAGGQKLTFEIELQYTMDVTLQMRYSLKDGTPVRIDCENGRQETAETVYDDQLTDDTLTYVFSILGEDAQDVSVESVACFQSGSGRTLPLSETGSVRLMQGNNGEQGQNNFTVRARDTSGGEYIFRINVPYKHRGTRNVRIKTDLDDTHEIINETITNMRVTAATLDDAGNVAGYIPANGTNTILRVELDGVEIGYTSSSGVYSEYELYPANPETGDTNTHTLYIYAEDAQGNYGEKTLTFTGLRRESGQQIGTAAIYIDMTALGIGVIGPVPYKVLADEPVSYVVAKAVMGMDTGDPFGAAYSTFGFSGTYAGTLDTGFYLQSLNTGYTADALEGGSWPGSSEEEVLSAIDARFGAGTGLASLWRCLYRNGLNKSTGSGGTFGEFDYTSGSGWMYSVGSATYYPGQSMSSVYLRDGDVLTLRYTLAYGWDVGGGSAGYGNTVGYCVTALNGQIHVSHRMEQVEGPDGTLSYVCRCCGLREDCTHEHTVYKDLEDGTHILFCEDCETAIGDPAPHNWTQGADSHVCADCGAEEAHTWVEVDGSNTATCTESGVRTVQCSVCGAAREEEAPPKGHTLDNRWNYTAADHYQRCSTCGEEMNRGSHQYRYSADWDDYMCDVCGALHDFDVGCAGHLTILEATCQRITYSCDGCGHTLIREGTFEEYHVYENGFCRYCGAEDPNSPTEHVHDYRQTQSVSPTCTEDGYILYTCSGCGESYTQTLPATGHSWGEWTIVTEPTEEEEGARVRTCLVCGEEDWQSIERLSPNSVKNVLARIFREKKWGKQQ